MRFFRLQLVVLSIAALWVGLVCAPLAHAVNTNARIKGVVTDPQDAVIAGAQITATNVATGVKYVTVSGQTGLYFFPQLPIGQYTISATMQGFRSFNASGIVLNIDQEYIQHIRMTLGAASEVVEVTASSVQVDTTDMQFSNIVDSQQMVELPLLGRNFAGLELTLPGVQAPSADRITGNSVSGSQQQQSAFLVNGADSNDIALNTQVMTPILDAIGQFNLIDGPMNAEYARNSGAVISASIKSGANKVHGDAFEFYRDTFLNTNNFFQKSATGAPTAVSPYHQHIVGGTLGGPILKNKLFVFGAFEARPQRVPQAAGTVQVYTTANLNGDFTGDLDGSGPAGVPFSTNPIPSTITIPNCTAGQTWAQCLGTGSANAGHVPTTAFNTVAKALVDKYVPAPNSGTNGYVFNATTTRWDPLESTCRHASLCIL